MLTQLKNNQLFNDLIKKHYLVIIVGVLVVIIALSMLFLSSNNSEDLRPQRSPSPTSNQSTGELPVDPETGEFYSKSYLDEQAKINEQQSSQLIRDSKVSELITSLPYRGRYNTITYILTTNQVVVSQDIDNLDAADREFQDFLKKFGIEDISWIPNLVVQSE